MIQGVVQRLGLRIHDVSVFVSRLPLHDLDVGYLELDFIQNLLNLGVRQAHYLVVRHSVLIDPLVQQVRIVLVYRCRTPGSGVIVEEEVFDSFQPVVQDPFL